MERLLNEMPFDMSIEMVIMDENNVPVDIQFPAQEVKGQSERLSSRSYEGICRK